MAWYDIPLSRVTALLESLGFIVGGVVNSALANTIPVSDGTDLVPANTLASSFPVSTGSLTVITTEPAPGAQTATNGGAGTNALNASSYSWKVVYVTAAGHTEAGTVSNAITVNPATQAAPSITLPIGSNFVTARELYRNKASDQTHWFLVDTINDNASVAYLDNIADSALGAAAPSTNTTANPKLLLSPSAANRGGISQDATTTTITSAALTINDLGFNGVNIIQPDGGVDTSILTSGSLTLKGASFDNLLAFRQENGTITAPTKTLNNDVLGTIYFKGTGPAGAPVDGANVQAVALADATDGGVLTALNLNADATTGVITLSSKNLITTLPTSDPMVVGALWSNLGAVQVSAAT